VVIWQRDAQFFKTTNARSQYRTHTHPPSTSIPRHRTRPIVTKTLIVRLHVPSMFFHQIEDSSSSPAFEPANNRQGQLSRPEVTAIRPRTIKTPISRTNTGKGPDAVSNPTPTSPLAEPAVTQARSRPRFMATPNTHIPPSEIPMSRPTPSPGHDRATILPDPGWYELPLTSVWSEDDWKTTMSDGVAASLRDVYEGLGLVTPFTNTPVAALERDITAAAAELIETCTMRTLIRAIDNPRLTMAMVGTLVGDHGRSVWGQGLGCSASSEGAE
jgi:hypothetical protein